MDEFDNELMDTIKRLDTDGYGADVDVLESYGLRKRWNIDEMNDRLKSLEWDGELYRPRMNKIKRL